MYSSLVAGWNIVTNEQSDKMCPLTVRSRASYRIVGPLMFVMNHKTTPGFSKFCYAFLKDKYSLLRGGIKKF